MIIKKYQNGIPVTESTDPAKDKQKNLDEASRLLKTIRRKKYETDENRQTTNPPQKKTGGVVRNPSPARRLVKKAPKKKGCGCGRKK